MLSSRIMRHLRSLGHALTPLVQIGKGGIAPALVAATSRALETHELVKVKILAEAKVERKEAAAELAKATGATLVQVLGKTLLLYKRNPKKPKIALP